MGQTLIEAGYGVLKAKDGLLALEMALRQVPDAGVVDQLLPPWGGEALVRKLRQRVPFFPIVMILEKGGREYMASALNCGANACIARPLEPSQIVWIVREVLGVKVN